MLVLTRSVDQRIFINDNIIVTVVAVNGGRVRLGFTAPESVRIDREEVYKDKLKHGRKNHDGRTNGSRGARCKHAAETAM